MNTRGNRRARVVGNTVQAVIVAIVLLLIGVWVSAPVRMDDSLLVGLSWMAFRSIVLGFVFGLGCLVLDLIDKHYFPFFRFYEFSYILIFLSFIFSFIFFAFGIAWFLVWLVVKW